MCGIIGYAGLDNAGDIIVHSLKSLEYRGYDSAGMTVFTDNGLLTVKTKGRVDELDKKQKNLLTDNAFCGIGHTRWATHGKPSEINAHPHGTNNVMIVHNGIIENYKEIRNELEEKGYIFSSNTDTESAALYIDMKYKETKNPVTAIRMAVNVMKGSYALGIVFSDMKDIVFAVKKDSPLLVGLSKNGNYIASDVSAFIAYTREYLRPDDGDIIMMDKSSVKVYGSDNNEKHLETETASEHTQASDKNGFPHFMLKEIFDEQRVLNETYDSLVTDGLPDFSSIKGGEKFLSKVGLIKIASCGTAMHAGLIGKYYIEKLSGIPVTVETAGEFRYGELILRDDDLVIVISQSGETADTLAALRLVNKNDVETLSIVNTFGSTIARESNHVIYTKAGTETAVASTKAFSVQTEVMLILAVKLALVRKKITEGEAKRILADFKDMVNMSLQRVFDDRDHIRLTAEKIADCNDVFFIGRGYDNYMGMEASLKLKEISYIHSEAYPAGELKHGTISLVEEGTPVIAIATNEKFYDKMRSNIEEVRSRGAYVISVCTEDAEIIKGVSDDVITIPCDNIFARPVTAGAAIQLFAYYTALALGRDIDKPRNLAKSVTVE